MALGNGDRNAVRGTRTGKPGEEEGEGEEEPAECGCQTVFPRKTKENRRPCAFHLPRRPLPDLHLSRRPASRKQTATFLPANGCFSTPERDRGRGPKLEMQTTLHVRWTRPITRPLPHNFPASRAGGPWKLLDRSLIPFSTTRLETRRMGPLRWKRGNVTFQRFGSCKCSEVGKGSVVPTWRYWVTCGIQGELELGISGPQLLEL